MGSPPYRQQPQYECAMVKTSNTPPRSTVIRMIGGGKGVLDGELVGHVVQEVVGRDETKVMIGWSGIQ